jgi:hypothetical protein
MKPREALGEAIGQLWAPGVAAITKLRHARMFHPSGHTFVGRVEAIDGPLSALGRDLEGRVLARLSSALWRGGWEHFDVLGLALRFRRAGGPDFDERAYPGDQDLLTATIRSPLTMLGAPFVTDASDFVANTYWAVSPFEHDVGRVELRLVPIHPASNRRGTRAEQLRAAVAAGLVAWSMQARRTLTLRWHPVARVELSKPIELDQERLAFDPFRGALRPVGVVHAIRRAVYSAGQRARLRSP